MSDRSIWKYQNIKNYTWIIVNNWRIYRIIVSKIKVRQWKPVSNYFFISSQIYTCKYLCMTSVYHYLQTIYRYQTPAGFGKSWHRCSVRNWIIIMIIMHHAMYIYSPCHHVELVRLLEIKYRNHYIVSFLCKNNITL